MKHFFNPIGFFILLTQFVMLNSFSQSVDAGTDTTICKGNSIKLGSTVNDPSWCYTWSPNDGTISDRKSPEPDINPTVTTTYELTAVGENFSFSDDDEVNVKVINPTVKFKVDTLTQKFGFDDFGVNSTIPWKSVKSGDNDIVIAETTPIADYGHIFFKSTETSNSTLMPNKAASAKENITVTGVSDGTSELQANGDKVDGITLNKMNVECYDERTKTVAFILIIEENDDIQSIGVDSGMSYQNAIEVGTDGVFSTIPGGDDEIIANAITTGMDGVCQSIAVSDDVQVIPKNRGLPNQICISGGVNNFRDTKNKMGDDLILGEDIITGADGICNTSANNTDFTSTNANDAAAVNYLKKVYDQAVVTWTAYRLSECYVNYDLNRDDSIDVDSWMNVEMSAIRDKCENTAYDNNLFFVDNPSDGSLGYMSFNQRYGYLHMDNSPLPGNTIAHELGHGAFGLVHTPADIDNLMHPTDPDAWRLRKTQWDQVNPWWAW